ncbi:unnamed protein product [Meganyctiphanes norvegica]|uniref:Uncharacterized protein n=1 Tax=Meganyctiphanes norvegica TaxID=48144 RepID=A0AAV2S9W5_MEGNR
MDSTEILLNSDSEEEIFFGAVRSPEKKKAELLRNRKTEVFEAPLFVRRRSARPSLSSHLEEDGDKLNEQDTIDVETETTERLSINNHQLDNFSSSYIDSQSSSLECTKGSFDTQIDSWLTDKENDVSKSQALCFVRDEISLEEVCIGEEKSLNEKMDDKISPEEVCISEDQSQNEVGLADSVISEVSATESYGEKTDYSMETSIADSQYECVENISNEASNIALEHSENINKKYVNEINKEKDPLFIRSDFTREIHSKEAENSSISENVENKNNCLINLDNKSQDEQNLNTTEVKPSLSSNVEKNCDNLYEQDNINLETETTEGTSINKHQIDNFSSSCIDSQSSSLECTKGSFDTQIDFWLTDKENDVSKNQVVCLVRDEISLEVCIGEEKSQNEKVDDIISLKEVCISEDKSQNEVGLADSIISEVSATESYGEKTDYSMETSNADSQYECVENGGNEPSNIALEHSKDINKKYVNEINKEKVPLFIRSDFTREIHSKETENSSVSENVETENNCLINIDNKSQDDAQNLNTTEVKPSLSSNVEKNCDNLYEQDDIKVETETTEGSSVTELQADNCTSSNIDLQSSSLECTKGSFNTQSDSWSMDKENYAVVRQEICLEEVCLSEEKSHIKEVGDELSHGKVFISEDKSQKTDPIISEVICMESHGKKTCNSLETSEADSQDNCINSSSESSLNFSSDKCGDLNKKDPYEINKDKNILFVRSNLTKKINLEETENVSVRENIEPENNKSVSICDTSAFVENREIAENDSLLPETTIKRVVDEINLFKNHSKERHILSSPQLIKDKSPKVNGCNLNVDIENVCFSDGSTSIRPTKPRESFFTCLEVIDVENDDVYEGFMANKGNGLLSDDSGVSASFESSNCIEKYEISHQNQKTPNKKQTFSEHKLDNSMNYESSPVTPPPDIRDTDNSIRVDDNDDSVVSPQSYSFTKPTSFINWTRTNNSTFLSEKNSNSDCISPDTLKNTIQSNQESDQYKLLVNENEGQSVSITTNSQDNSNNQITRSVTSIDSYGDINKGMADSKTLSVNSSQSSHGKVESPITCNNTDYRSPMTEYEMRHTSYNSAQEEASHQDTTNEDECDHLNRSVESSNPGGSPKRRFNDTIEEMEMLLKYGVNYCEDKNDQRNNHVVPNNYEDGSYIDSCSDEEIVVIPSPRKNSVASIVSNFQPVLDSTRADLTKASVPDNTYVNQPWENHKEKVLEPWKPYQKIQNVSCGSPEVQILSPVEIVRKKPPVKPPRNVNSPLLYSPKLTSNESKIPSPNATLTKYSLSPNLTPGGSRKMSPNLVNNGINSYLPSPRISPSTPGKPYLGCNAKQVTPKTATSKVPNSSPYTTPRSRLTRVVRESPSRTTVNQIGGSARKAVAVNRGTNLVRTGSLTNLADQRGEHTPKSVGTVRLPSKNTRVGGSSNSTLGMKTKDALPPRPTPSKQSIKTVTRQPSHTNRHLSTPQNKATRVVPTTSSNNKLNSPAMRKVNQATKVVGGLSIVSPVAKYLQSNPPPQFVVNVQSKSRSSPKSCKNSPTSTKIPSPVSTQNIFDNSGMERQIRLNKIQDDMEKLNLKMLTQVSAHSPKENSTSGRKKKIKIALPNNIVYKPALVHMENKENDEGYRRRITPTKLIQDSQSVKIFKHQGRIQLPAEVYLDDEDSEDCVSPGVLSHMGKILMKSNMVDMSVLEPHNVQHTNTIQKRSKPRVPY